MNWLLARLFTALFGPASMTDDLMDGITLAINEEAARLNLTGKPTVIVDACDPHAAALALAKRLGVNGCG